MMNITRRSTSSAVEEGPEASRQVQTSARGPAGRRDQRRASASTRSGSVDHHLDLVGGALAVEVALRLVERHVDAGPVDVEAPDPEDVGDLVVADAAAACRTACPSPRARPASRRRRPRRPSSRATPAADGDAFAEAGRASPAAVSGLRDQRHRRRGPRAACRSPRPRRRGRSPRPSPGPRISGAARVTPGHRRDPRRQLVVVGDQPARPRRVVRRE